MKPQVVAATCGSQPSARSAGGPGRAGSGPSHGPRSSRWGSRGGHPCAAAASASSGCRQSAGRPGAAAKGRQHARAPSAPASARRRGSSLRVNQPSPLERRIDQRFRRRGIQHAGVASVAPRTCCGAAGRRSGRPAASTSSSLGFGVARLTMGDDQDLSHGKRRRRVRGWRIRSARGRGPWATSCARSFRRCAASRRGRGSARRGPYTSG